MSDHPLFSFLILGAAGFIVSSVITVSAYSQNNYEIQVYASPTQAAHSTMFELHSHYTFIGSTQVVDGVIPSDHALH